MKASIIGLVCSLLGLLACAIVHDLAPHMNTTQIYLGITGGVGTLCSLLIMVGSD